VEKVTFDKVVGFILAILFALVIGISMQGTVVGDYTQANTVANEQTQQTLRILGLAGGLAALVAWWVQSFAASRGFVVRVLFALFVFVVAFVSFGALLRVIFSQWDHPSLLTWTLSDFYWVPYDNLITFIFFMLRPVAGLIVLMAAVYLALFGPRAARTITARRLAI
jgi:hypothetical protein